MKALLWSSEAMRSAMEVVAESMTPLERATFWVTTSVKIQFKRLPLF